MPSIHELPTPALLLDIDRLESNLRDMAKRAHRLGVRIRPHIKTHKCIEIARAQAALGAHGITVSTLEEAAAFARHGFDDVTWAYPVILSRLGEVAECAEQIRFFGVVADSEQAVDALAGLGSPLRVWLKIDCGYHRAGLAPESPQVIKLARRVSEAAELEFAGLLSHSGHAYHARSGEHIRQIAHDEARCMSGLAEQLRSAGLEVPDVSVGSTPAAMRTEDLSGVTEIRPGNYALFDYTQTALGSCTASDCAVTVLASVISSREDLQQSIVDAGALALSLDSGPAHVADRTFGRVFDNHEQGRLSASRRLVALSQEHGHLQGTLPIGERIRILPNHSCPAIACFDAFHVVRGDDVVDEWKVWRHRVT